MANSCDNIFRFFALNVAEILTNFFSLSVPWSTYRAICNKKAKVHVFKTNKIARSRRASCYLSSLFIANWTRKTIWLRLKKYNTKAIRLVIFAAFISKRCVKFLENYTQCLRFICHSSFQKPKTSRLLFSYLCFVELLFMFLEFFIRLWIKMCYFSLCQPLYFVTLSLRSCQ